MASAQARRVAAILSNRQGQGSRAGFAEIAQLVDRETGPRGRGEIEVYVTADTVQVIREGALLLQHDSREGPYGQGVVECLDVLAGALGFAVVERDERLEETD